MGRPQATTDRTFGMRRDWSGLDPERTGNPFQPNGTTVSKDYSLIKRKKLLNYEINLAESYFDPEYEPEPEHKPEPWEDCWACWMAQERESGGGYCDEHRGQATDARK